MPLTWGGAVSDSPLLYRPRGSWDAVAAVLRGSVTQPAAAGTETAARLDEYAAEIEVLFERLRQSLDAARLDVLVVLTADDGRAFADDNFPQVHVYAGDAVWSDTSVAQAGEAAARRTHACDPGAADELIAELFDSGFDVAESHGPFAPVGDPQRGAVPALIEPLVRLGCAIPIVPVHINCHVAPAMRGSRVADLGQALGRALSQSHQRIGILASGGLSGDPGGYLAGWIDPELDQWVLRQLDTSRSPKLAPMFDLESQALRGNAAQIRLWLAAASAMESVQAQPKRLGYLPLHTAAAGLGFFAWEVRTCP